MKAVQISEYGGSDKIKIVADATKPALKSGQILIEVHASSINPIDIAIRNGHLAQMLPLEFPITLGGDFSGVVSEVGEGVEDFKVGDQVYGNAGHLKGGTGSWSEYVAAMATNTGMKPESVDDSHAAAIPLVGTSAIQALEEHIKLQKDQKILIHGGVGGIGSLAIQLAKLHGAFVITTVTKEDFDFVKKLGADQMIDYKSEKFEEMLKELDAVYDTVGGETLTNSFKVLKKGGVLVTMAGQPDQEAAKAAEITAIQQMTTISTEQLGRLKELVDSGKLVPQIDKIFSLDQAKEASDYQVDSHPKGKVIIQVKS